MLRPTKYTDINVSIIGLSYEILKYMGRQNIETYSGLLAHIVRVLGVRAKVNFLAALNFLFLLGVLEYSASTDSVHFVEKV